MLILGISTSTARVGCAIGGHEGILGAVYSSRGKRHAETLTPAIEFLCTQTRVDLSDIGAVAVDLGPGMFTGLRVGIAAARAFAFGIGVPVHPVVSHDAIAYGQSGRVLVVTDARRREVAWSVYDPEVTRVAGPELCLRDEFAAIEARHPGVPVLAPATVSAASLGLVAAMLLAADRPLGPAEPVYLRAPDVTLPPPRPGMPGVAS